LTRRFTVRLTAAAQQDLDDVYEYVASHDAVLKAEQLLDKIGQALDGLATFPERGAVTKELLAIGIRDYRETYFKPYRIIYQVEGGNVNVYVVADGRRDMATLLQKRLLRA
jgi:toxin ParE1/3/4